MSSPSPKPQGGATLIVVGLALAALAVVLVNVYAQVLVNKSREKTFTAYQFTTAVDADRPLQMNALKEVQIPDEFKGSFDNLVPKDAVAGLADGSRKIARASHVGSLLTYGFIKGGRTGRDADDAGAPIPAGKVAVAIKVDNLPASLNRSYFVDLLVNVPAANSRSGMRCLPLMEYVKVRARGGTVFSDADAKVRNGSSVAEIDVELTPEQAIQIKNIQRAIGGAAFEVSVRNDDDRASHGLVPDMTEMNPEVFKALGIPFYKASKD